VRLARRGRPEPPALPPRRSDGGGPFGSDIQDVEWEYRPPKALGGGGRPALGDGGPGNAIELMSRTQPWSRGKWWVNPPNPTGNIIGGLNTSAGDPNHPLDKSMFSVQGLGIAAGVATTALTAFANIVRMVNEYEEGRLRADALRLHGETSLSRAQDIRTTSNTVGKATQWGGGALGAALAALGVATGNPALVATGLAITGTSVGGGEAIKAGGEYRAGRIERDIAFMKQVEARIAQVGMYNPATAMASAQRRALGIGLDAREAQALGPEYAAMTAAQARLEAAERVVKVVEDQKRLREQEIATNQRTRELMMELNKAMQGADKNTKRMVEIMLGNSNPLAKFFQKLDLPEWGDMREGTDDLGKLRDEQMARPVYEGL
jgi:hypothetical protein